MITLEQLVPSRGPMRCRDGNEKRDAALLNQRPRKEGLLGGRFSLRPDDADSGAPAFSWRFNRGD